MFTVQWMSETDLVFVRGWNVVLHGMTRHAVDGEEDVCQNYTVVFGLGSLRDTSMIIDCILH